MTENNFFIIFKSHQNQKQKTKFFTTKEEKMYEGLPELAKIAPRIEEWVSELIWVHTNGMVPIGKKLANDMGADEKVVLVAILFHDVAKDDHPSNHAYMGSRICNDKLQEWNYDQEFISRVVHCVRAHAWAWGEEEHYPQTVEAQVVFDADMIQQLGSMGVMKHLCFKYKEVSSLREKVNRTQKDLARASELVLTSAGKEMASMEKVNRILHEIMIGA